jgi:salicylate hydroxylase
MRKPRFKSNRAKIYHGDLVVGADGLWSVCRKSLLGENSKPQPTGDLAYRIVLRLDQVPDAEPQRMIKEPACRLWIGPNSQVVAYSFKGGQQFNIVLLVPDDLPPDVIKTAGDISEMRALFRDWEMEQNKNKETYYLKFQGTRRRVKGS